MPEKSNSEGATGMSAQPPCGEPVSVPGIGMSLMCILRRGHAGDHQAPHVHSQRYFLDTEFIESGPTRPIDLLSVGIVCEDGREFYAVNSNAVLANASPWVEENVLPYLGKTSKPLEQIAREVVAFVGSGKPEFWGYYADYDWVVFCQMFGTMMDLPKGWSMYCRDLKQWCGSLGNPKLPAQSPTEHNALNDARWNKIAYDFLAARASVSLPQLAKCEPDCPCNDSDTCNYEEPDAMLRPCPFCRGYAEMGENDDGANFIECTKCGASTNLQYSLKEDARPDLKSRWNHRRAAGVSLPAPPQWISVEERLPAKCDVYLGFVPPNIMGVAFYVDGHWNWPDNENDREAFGLTHWMPLPEPPKSEAGAPQPTEEK